MFLLLVVFFGSIPAPTNAATKTIQIPKQASVDITPEWPWSNRFSILNAHCGGGLIKIIDSNLSNVEFKFKADYMKIFVYCKDGGNKNWHGGVRYEKQLSSCRTDVQWTFDNSGVSLKSLTGDILWRKDWLATDGQCLNQPTSFQVTAPFYNSEGAILQYQTTPGNLINYTLFGM